MRIYEGSPRQDFEEVLRSIGALLDRRAMREVMLVEVPDGFLVQGLVRTAEGGGGWSESMGQETKETLPLLDDDISRFMDEALQRRGQEPASEEWTRGGYYEKAFRVLGRYIDEQRPRDVFFLEQDGAFVVRLLTATQAGNKHVLVEFTKDDIQAMIAAGPSLRNIGATKAGSAPA